MKIKKGEFVILVGNVGAGKSSFLNAINGNMIYVPRTIVDILSDNSN